MMNPTQMNASAPTPFVRTKKVTLRYADRFVMNSSSGAASYQTFRINDCYDPDYTNTGHQPLYFDQFCSSTGPYSSFRVLGSRFVVEVCPDQPTYSYPMMVAMGPVNNSTGPPHALVDSGITSLLELPGWTGGICNSGAPARKFKCQYDVAKLFGVPQKAIEIEEEYEGGYGASPTDQWFHTIAIQTADTASQSYAIVNVFIEYDVKFQNVVSAEPAS